MDLNLTLLPALLTAYLDLSGGFIHEHPAMVSGCRATVLRIS